MLYTVAMAGNLSQMKVYDLVDIKDRFVRTGTKREARRLGLFTRSVHVFLENDRGEILTCLRPKSKKTYPNKFTSSAGGHVERGEGYLAAACRELKEELGIATPIRDIGRFDVVSRTERAIHHLFVGKARRITPDIREIAGYRFMRPETAVRQIKKKPQKYALPFRKALDMYISTRFA